MKQIQRAASSRRSPVILESGCPGAEKGDHWTGLPKGDKYDAIADSQKNLGDLISQARTISIRDGGADRGIDLTTLRNLATLVEQARGILGDAKRDSNVGAVNEGNAWSSCAASSKVLGELGDLCFLVSEELKASRGHFDRLSAESGYLAVFSFLEQTETKLMKGPRTLSDLARISGLSSTTRHADLCRNSLRVRHLLGKFRLRVATAAARRDDLEQTLLSVGASFAWLRAQDDFSQVRAADRLTAKELQGRIVEWLRSADRDEIKGRHVWEEITSFMALVDLINHRQAQVERDLAAVTDLIGLLGDVESNTHVPEALAERLQFLLSLKASARPSARHRTMPLRGFA